jgi:hypothetical protein
MLRLALAALVAAVAAAATAGQVDATSPPMPLVTYTRTGGFIGVQDSMRIFPNGTVTSTNGDFRLSPARVAALRKQLRAARFPSLKRRYRAEYPIADGFVYGVWYLGRTVVVNEEAKTPLRLRRVLDTLAEIFVERA